jgi:16S rRNA (uracil1498-N3)-methyltransferase
MEEYRDLNLSRRRFCVAMSVLKPVSKLEFAIEKCTELGAADFLLFNSERSGKAVIRLERMAGIARSAVKQSLQSRIPGLTFVEGLEEVVSQSHPYEEKFVLHEQSADMIDKFLPPMKEDTSVIALIGPEGGFSREEVGFLAGRGFKIVSVGRSRLRSETAAIKIASLLGVY